VEVDLHRLLQRVVGEVMGADIQAVYSEDPKHPRMARVELAAPGDDKHARLRAAYEWFEVSIPDLGVNATLFEYDDTEEDKASVLREVALVAAAYLRGEGRIEYKRGLFGTRPVLTVEVNGREWRLGRRTSQVHYPSDRSSERSEGS
jgi:hypothetical protein